MAQANYKTETGVVRSVAANPSCHWIWTRHAREEMRNDQRVIADIQHALTNGHVDLIERKQDDVWRVLGRDLDGKPCGVACAVDEDIPSIKVITTF
ncbi:DUF4258 domain-containing protein [Lichenibacterium minor]|nr:DUF4258 domain-containing protein [Lichenibacterium minor]